MLRRQEEDQKKYCDILHIFEYIYKHYVIKKQNKTNMKKIVALFAIVALASCGAGTSTEVSTDSTAVVVDSTKTDTTVESVKVAAEEVK